MNDIIIIGGGPAGLTAAIYSLRSGKSVLLFEKEAFGGQIYKTSTVENYPGIKSVSGMDFSNNLYEQAKASGCEFVFGEVTKIEKNSDGFFVQSGSKSYSAKAVIFALGAKPRQSGLENENDFVGRGVSYCAVCDGAFFKNRDVAVIGGGSTALQDAIYLSSLCNKVYLVHRRNEFRGEKGLYEKIKASENVEVIFNSVLTKMSGEKLLSEIEIMNKETNQTRKLPVSGLFMAIGQLPQTEKFGDILPLDKYGYVETDESCTVGEGIYVCGDCRKKAIRQLTTAVGDGTVASVKACEYIDGIL